MIPSRSEYTTASGIASTIHWNISLESSSAIEGLLELADDDTVEVILSLPGALTWLCCRLRRAISHRRNDAVCECADRTVPGDRHDTVSRSRDPLAPSCFVRPYRETTNVQAGTRSTGRLAPGRGNPAVSPPDRRAARSRGGAGLRGATPGATDRRGELPLHGLRPCSETGRGQGLPGS